MKGLLQGWPNNCLGAKKCTPRLFYVPSKLFLKRSLHNIILNFILCCFGIVETDTPCRAFSFFLFLSYVIVVQKSCILFKAVYLAEWYGFQRSSFTRKAFFEHNFVPANFLRGTFMPSTKKVWPPLA